MEPTHQKHAQPGTSMQPKKSSPADNGDAMVVLLTKLGYARQSVIDPNVLDYFASELEGYELVDVTAAIEAIIGRRRAEGETAFPELATLTDGVRTAMRKRKERERNANLRLPADIQKLVDEDAESTRKLEAGETDGVSVAELVDGLPRKIPQLGTKTAPVAPVAPQAADCPHCGPASPQDAAGLRRLANYYATKAERAEDREKAQPEESEESWQAGAAMHRPRDEEAKA